MRLWRSSVKPWRMIATPELSLFQGRKLRDGEQIANPPVDQVVIALDQGPQGA